MQLDLHPPRLRWHCSTRSPPSHAHLSFLLPVLQFQDNLLPPGCAMTPCAGVARQLAHHNPRHEPTQAPESLREMAQAPSSRDHDRKYPEEEANLFHEPFERSSRVPTAADPSATLRLVPSEHSKVLTSTGPLVGLPEALLANLGTCHSECSCPNVFPCSCPGVCLVRY